ncbi:MAG: hypothetical protein GXP43_00965 [bacterium]|nr:hypothetical protein [bacterium]
MWQRFKSLSGSSLVEVLVIVTILSFVLIAMLNASMVAIVQTKHARNKALATRYTQEGLDWVRALRDRQNNWNDFVNLIFGVDWGSVTDGEKKTFCLSSLALNQGACSAGSFITGTKFTREMEVVADTTKNYLTVTVKTGWRDALCKNPSDYFCHNIKVSTILSTWQD